MTEQKNQANTGRVRQVLGPRGGCGISFWGIAPYFNRSQGERAGFRSGSTFRRQFVPGPWLCRLQRAWFVVWK